MDNMVVLVRLLHYCSPRKVEGSDVSHVHLQRARTVRIHTIAFHIALNEH